MKHSAHERSNPSIEIGDEILTGRVKWFNDDKKYGFIVPDDSAAHKGDVFLHIKALDKIGLSTIKPNVHVQFQLARRAEKVYADNLKLLD